MTFTFLLHGMVHDFLLYELIWVIKLLSDAIPSIQEILDSIEFARGSSNSTWGSARAAMGHTQPFQLNYVAVGNEDCGLKYYRGLFFSCIA